MNATALPAALSIHRSNPRPDAADVWRSADGAAAPTQPPRRGVMLAVAGAHALLAWALWHSLARQPVVADPPPLKLLWLSTAPVAPAPRPTPPAPPLRAPAAMLAPVPPLPLDAAAVPHPTAETPPEPAALMTTAAPTPAPVVAAPQPTPAPPVAPLRIPAHALRYTRLPQQLYPLASRRAGEQGVVQVQVLVDVRGQPRQVSLHRSSGHPRLDEQALDAMRAARFQPCTEQGQPVECIAIAPLAYELD